ncbi:MAG: lipopolysaccharide heptosyltransferase I [Gallionella sp.]
MAHDIADPDTPRILLVKTTSLGDVLHNLPVVSDIVRHHPNAQIDWIAEESFAALPKLHPAIHNVIPVAVRRWRKNLFNANTWREIRAFRSMLAWEHYDICIDTQGLIKSALLMRGANGTRCGYDKDSAREPLAANMYQYTYPVTKGQHAVERNRQLVAQALSYTLDGSANFGIRLPQVEAFNWLPHSNNRGNNKGDYAVLLHATSRDDKLWDEVNWVKLGNALHQKGIRCVLPWGSTSEQTRSERIAAQITDAIVPPRLSLDLAAALLGKSRAVIGVDTGLAHLAAAVNVPTVGIYTATDPTLTGLYTGERTLNLGNIGQSPDVASVLDTLNRMNAC